MMQTTQGSLTMVGLNTITPSVFWNGARVPHVTAIRVDWEGDEQRVKLRVHTLDLLHDEMGLSGIQIKLERRYE